jgi:hypothetical protein
MEITTNQVAAYVGAGAATGAGFSALRHGVAAKPLALGIATGAIAGGVQSLVQEKTGSSELGWAAAAGTGALAGAALLGGFARPGMSPMQARGIGAAIGGITGILAPIVAGVVLAQLQPND